MAEINFTAKAADDYIALDHSIRLEVRAAIAKLQRDPRRYGEPLGIRNGIDLYGRYSIRAGRRIRVIYTVDEQDAVIIRIIGKRDRFLVHKEAQKRIQSYREATKEELIQLQDLLAAAGDE